MTPPAPLISVIVPVHDVAGHVGPCIASLRAQSLGDFEAIVVDDGSTDGSGAAARAAIGGDPRFRLVAQENRGLSGARNTGLDLARGAFVAFLDGDDRLAPDYLARLHAALDQSGADWAACGVRDCHPDGGTADHPAIHGGAAPAGPQLCDIGDWRAVIRHYPSAWNKLYRRRLIEGLRFDEGTWYEDHAFFWQAAARTGRLMHLPDPLYWQSQGRPGQITATESDRVFEQIDVLERLAEIAAASDKPGGPEALARSAARLSFERSLVLRDPDRRARFAAATRAFLDRHGLSFSAAWDPEISPAWGLTVAGTLPLSVVIPSDGQGAPLGRTLDSLGQAGMPEAEILVVTDGAPAPALGAVAAAAGARCLAQTGQGAGPARDHGAAAARGRILLCLDAGDLVRPHALRHWVDAMLREEADLGLSAFRVGTGPGDVVHSGLHDAAGGPELPARAGPVTLDPGAAVRLHAHPSAKLFRRGFWQEAGLAFGDGPLGDWSVTLAATLAAGRAVYQPDPAIEVSERPEERRLWHRPVPAAALARGVRDLAALHGAARLPEGWRRRLYARAVWEKLHFAPPPGPAARTRFVLAAALAGRRAGLAAGQGPLDPYVEPSLGRWLFAGPTSCIARPRRP
ncbi:Glycosyl transferase family 2 [Tranquillimonas rosea]|uniref:Glycosyl transferase family 2 n=1 Tax=Tranquillimonas rosea TaxID=641238 RepID=A0A1H9WZD4_9RHOB|nr:glycosyltransferase [Tranquillimonas rosea]SES39199.1 Glycosyl transferase family 2 [Tranquillimonas rosea]